MAGRAGCALCALAAWLQRHPLACRLCTCFALRACKTSQPLEPDCRARPPPRAAAADAPHKVFGSLRGLKDHLLKNHKLQFCDICLEGRKVGGGGRGSVWAGCGRGGGLGVLLVYPAGRPCTWRALAAASHCHML